MELQFNYTTPEQSQRLLELGLPVDSADCILRHYNWADEDLKEENWENPAIINKGISPSEAMDMFLDDEYDMTMPCWSVGRLIEIFNLINKQQERFLFWMNLSRYKITNYVGVFVMALEELKIHDALDLSKLSK